MSNLSMIGSTIAAVAALSACTTTEAYSPDKLNQQYGINGAYYDTVATADGDIRGTVVPVTLADGRSAQLVIPVSQRNQPRTVYLRDNDGLHAVQVQDNTTREQVVRSPQIVTRRAAEPAPANKRPWTKDALIIGGGAGGGALIGALAGGKKGAAVGAATGGVGGLIYDLATRH